MTNEKTTPTGRQPSEPNIQSSAPHTETGDKVRAAFTRNRITQEGCWGEDSKAQAKVEQEADQLYHACAVIDWLAERVRATTPEDENESFGEKIALIHADLSSALSVRLDGGRLALLHREDGKPGVPLRLAAALVRLLDTCREYNIPIGEAVHEALIGGYQPVNPKAP